MHENLSRACLSDLKSQAISIAVPAQPKYRLTDQGAPGPSHGEGPEEALHLLQCAGLEYDRMHGPADA
jgi:hypothetical protein